MKPQNMKCANLYGVGDLRYTEIPLPECADDEVLVAVRCCGICGSDIPRVFTHGTYHFPTVIGHEFSGVVVEDKAGRLIGQRVAVFPLLPCFSCEACQNENYTACANYDYYGSRRNGGMAEYIAVKRWNLVPLPDSIGYDVGAMCEPISVARHAVGKLRIQNGEALLISGAGPIGIIAGQWAKAAGAGEVYYFDIDRRKTEFAESLGFRTYDGKAVIDCAIEGTGHGDALEGCLSAVRAAGRIVLMGNPAGDILLPQKTYWQILRRELTLCGTWNSAYGEELNDWRESIRALADGTIDVTPLITHKYPLRDAYAALDMMRTRTEFYQKVMITLNDEELTK